MARRDVRLGFVAAILAIVAVALVAYGPAVLNGSLGVAGPIVDGFPIGTPVSCAGDPETCAQYVALATGSLDARDIHHAAITSATAYYEDLHNPSIFDLSVPHARSGVVIAVVFSLADRSTRATGVACVGINPCVGVGSYPH